MKYKNPWKKLEVTPTTTYTSEALISFLSIYLLEVPPFEGKWRYLEASITALPVTSLDLYSEG